MVFLLAYMANWQRSVLKKIKSRTLKGSLQHQKDRKRKLYHKWHVSENPWPLARWRHCHDNCFFNHLKVVCMCLFLGPANNPSWQLHCQIVLCVLSSKLSMKHHVLLSPHAGQHEKSSVLHSRILPQALWWGELSTCRPLSWTWTWTWYLFPYSQLTSVFSGTTNMPTNSSLRMLVERHVCIHCLSHTTCSRLHRWSSRTFRKTWQDFEKTCEVTDAQKLHSLHNNYHQCRHGCCSCTIILKVQH